MIDFLNSSEASGMGRSVTSRRGAAKGARFELGKNAFVIDDDGKPIAPGSGKVGRVAVRGIVPLGYYKDPEKTAATFPVIDGVRCAVPGDYATVEADGSITLLGRGSVSINTGGEKVFPEEVEEAIKTCPGVQDAVVVGVPDARLGQVVAAVVAGTAPDADAIKAHVREQARRLQGAAPRDGRRVGRAGGDRQGGLQGRARAHARVAGNERIGRMASPDDSLAASHRRQARRDRARHAQSAGQAQRVLAGDAGAPVRCLGRHRRRSAHPRRAADGRGHQAFSSGGDLGSVIPLMMRTRKPVGEWEERFAADRKQLGAAILRNATFFKPVVVAINGHAHAGGAEFLLSTDIRIMSSEATIALTEVRRGLIAGGGSLARLARQVPWAHAMELVLVGEPITAQQALAIGLVNRVVPPQDVLPTAEEFARKISLGAPVALLKSKEAIVRGSGRPLEDAFAIESQCTKENAATDDAKEGPRAFMEKRHAGVHGTSSQDMSLLLRHPRRGDGPVGGGPVRRRHPRRLGRGGRQARDADRRSHAHALQRAVGLEGVALPAVRLPQPRQAQRRARRQPARGARARATDRGDGRRVPHQHAPAVPAPRGPRSRSSSWPRIRTSSTAS